MCQTWSKTTHVLTEGKFCLFCCLCDVHVFVRQQYDNVRWCSLLTTLKLLNYEGKTPNKPWNLLFWVCSRSTGCRSTNGANWRSNTAESQRGGEEQVPRVPRGTLPTHREEHLRPQRPASHLKIQASQKEADSCSGDSRQESCPQDPHRPARVWKVQEDADSHNDPEPDPVPDPNLHL